MQLNKVLTVVMLSMSFVAQAALQPDVEAYVISLRKEYGLRGAAAASIVKGMNLAREEAMLPSSGHTELHDDQRRHYLRLAARDQRHVVILAGIKQVQESVARIGCNKQSKLRNRSCELVLSLPNCHNDNHWLIPVSSGLGIFKDKPVLFSVGFLVDHVLEEFGQQPWGTQTVVVEETIFKDTSSETYHFFRYDAQGNLVHEQFDNAEVIQIEGVDYQCRNGRMICESDLDLQQGDDSFIEFTSGIARCAKYYYYSDRR